MTIITDIEALCRQLDVEIPALNQLKLALNRNDKESVRRISTNILEYIAEQNPRSSSKDERDN
jgi:hypothetical protein